MEQGWKPVAKEQLAEIVTGALADCDPDERSLFEEHRVEFYPVPIRRLGKLDVVYVVAEFGRGLLYFEDIEEGFELAQLDDEGAIPSQGCSQFDLHHVLGRLRRREPSASTEVGCATFGQELFVFLTTLVPYWRVSDDAWVLEDGSHLGGISVQRNYGGDVLVVQWDPQDADLTRRLVAPRSGAQGLDLDRRVAVVDDRGVQRSDEQRPRIDPVRVVPWSARQLLAGIVIKDAP